MTLRAMVRLFDVLGRLVSVAVAALSAVLAVGWGYYVIRNYLTFPTSPGWSEAAHIFFFGILRLVVAGWVMWSALKKGAAYLLFALLVSGVGTFFGLLDFYSMIGGPENGFISLANIPYLVAICDLLYIAAGLVVSCALLLSRVSAQLGNDSP